MFPQRRNFRKSIKSSSRAGRKTANFTCWRRKATNKRFVSISDKSFWWGERGGRLQRPRADQFVDKTPQLLALRFSRKLSGLMSSSRRQYPFHLIEPK